MYNFQVLVIIDDDGIKGRRQILKQTITHRNWLIKQSYVNQEKSKCMQMKLPQWQKAEMYY